MQAGWVNAPMNWSDIFTAPAALYAFHVAVVRVPGAVQLMHTSPAALMSAGSRRNYRITGNPGIPQVAVRKCNVSVRYNVAASATGAFAELSLEQVVLDR